MKGRIRVLFPVQGVDHSFRKQVKGATYLHVLAAGRECVLRNTAGISDFRYEIEFQNRRLEWQIIETGTAKEPWLREADHSQCQKFVSPCHEADSPQKPPTSSKKPF